MKFRRSLLFKFIVSEIIFILLVPILFLLYNIIFFFITNLFLQDYLPPKPEYSASQVEKEWKSFAKEISHASDSEKAERLRSAAERYPKSTIFWVDDLGKTRLKLPADTSIPDQWSASELIAFMKRSYGGDPYTVVALLGEDQKDGFITIQIPRKLTYAQGNSITALYPITFLLLIFALSVIMSWWFFLRIRRRLVRLQDAMKEAEVTGVPIAVSVKDNDEIADLERSYNHMVEQLNLSRQREKEEERLRRQLIANLSHDLRTPLTALRGYAYQIHKEERLSEKGREALQLLDEKINYIGELIENLLTYTLISTGKYQLALERIELTRTLRSIIAAWYPALEKEGFEIEVDITDQPLYWRIDPQWFSRIMDNLIQNVLRHAAEGRYIGISLKTEGSEAVLIIEDHGLGVNAASTKKGAGIGLSIVRLMTKEMGIEWTMESDQGGTRAILRKPLSS